MQERSVLWRAFFCGNLDVGLLSDGQKRCKPVALAKARNRRRRTWWLRAHTTIVYGGAYEVSPVSRILDFFWTGNGVEAQELKIPDETSGVRSIRL